MFTKSKVGDHLYPLISILLDGNALQNDCGLCTSLRIGDLEALFRRWGGI